MDLLRGLAPTRAERRRELPGDGIVRGADVTMDRAFALPAPPEAVWPWIVQLGKDRAGWYLPRSVERFVPSGRRALRHVEPALQGLVVGDVIPDWGGREASFEAAILRPPTVLVHRTTRGAMHVSWAIVLRDDGPSGTRVHLRLRLGGVKHRRLAEYGGGFVDLATIAGLAAGLRERVREPAD